MQKEFLALKKQYERETVETKDMISTLKQETNYLLKSLNLINELKSVNINPIPIGFIYVQLPRQEEPALIWPNLEWQDISVQYENVFQSYR